MKNGYMCIAHDPAIQKMMDQLNVSWDVQYEIARGVCSALWAWDDVTVERLQALIPTRKNLYPAQRVGNVMGKGLDAQKLETW